MSNTATAKQVEFINSLKESRDISGLQAQSVLSVARELWRIQAFTVEAASTTIEALKGLPKSQARAWVEVPEGMHLVGGTVYKVQTSPSSGRSYAKKLVIETGSFIYSPGAMRILGPDTKMTYEQAKEFGALYGACCRCGRTLTDEKSIELGIGPVCGKREGWL